MNDSKASSGFYMACVAIMTIAFVGLVVMTTTHKQVDPVQPAQSQTPVLGGVNPDIVSPYVQWGGVYEYRAGVATVATSSVMCAIQAPAATSTLKFASFLPTANGLGSQVFSISTSSTAVGSSTPALVQSNSITIGTPVIWDGNPATTSNSALVLMNRDTTGLGSYIIKPSEYVNFRIATGTPGTFSSYVTGKCQATFLTL